VLKPILVLAVIAAPFIALMLGFTDGTEPAAFREPASYDEARALATNTPGYKNLQRIGLAFHGYHDVFGQFPAATLYAADGKTPRSWRVELLPVLKHYVDGVDGAKLRGNIGREQYDALIAECGYHVTRPWDSPENRSALAAIPADYRHPADNPDTTASAYYAVVGTGTTFDPADIAEYTDIRGWRRSAHSPSRPGERGT